MGFNLKLPNPSMWISSIKSVISDTSKMIHMFTNGSYASVGLFSPLLWNPSRVEQAFFSCAILSIVSSVLEILYNFQTYLFFGVLAPRIVTAAVVFVLLYGLGCCIQLYHKWSVPAWIYFGIGVLGALSLVLGAFQILGVLGQLSNGIVFVVIALLALANYVIVASLALDTFYDVVRGMCPFYDANSNQYVGRPFVDLDPFRQQAIANADYHPFSQQAEPNTQDMSGTESSVSLSKNPQQESPRETMPDYQGSDIL